MSFRDSDRVALRRDLLARRLAADPADRHRWERQIQGLLAEALPVASGLVIGFCWPMRGECDLRPLIGQLLERGAQAALPAVLGPDEPLQFRRWRPGLALVPGPWDIPFPPDPGTAVVPGLVLVPLVGFGPGGERLGYGGGYFDRTLEALSPRPLAIGVGFELARSDRIRLQVHDRPMDALATEDGLAWSEDGGLEPVGVAEFHQRARAFLRNR